MRAAHPPPDLLFDREEDSLVVEVRGVEGGEEEKGGGSTLAPAPTPTPSHPPSFSSSSISLSLRSLSSSSKKFSSRRGLGVTYSEPSSDPGDHSYIDFSPGEGEGKKKGREPWKSKVRQSALHALKAKNKLKLAKEAVEALKAVGGEEEEEGVMINNDEYAE